MASESPKILAYGPAGAGDGFWPGPIAWRSRPEPPDRAEILAHAWDYCYLGYDCDILDCRLFGLAAEYAAHLQPDLVLFSSPAWRAPSGKYERAEERFHILCDMAIGGGLYALGNKLFSRRLVAGVTAPLGAGFLSEAFRVAESLVVLAQPWVAVRSVANPSDAEFSAFVEHFAGEGGAAWT